MKEMNFKDERFEYAIGWALAFCRDELVACMVGTDRVNKDEADAYIDWLIYKAEFKNPTK